MSWVRLKGGLECGGCGRKDWCFVSDKGTDFLCMRVQSNRPVQMKDGSVGYIHYTKDRVPVPVAREERKPSKDIAKVFNDLVLKQQTEWREKLAKRLGVSYTSVFMIGACWSSKQQAWAFPMLNGYCKVVGIRYRNLKGEKWAERGSLNALFIPWDHYDKSTLWCAEGPTDVMAAVTLGLKCIGRPSCSAGMFDIITFIKQNRVRELVIVADSDKPGLEGAATLVRHLPIRSCIITPPTKDLRDFIKQGGTGSMLESMVKATVWNQPIVGDS